MQVNTVSNESMLPAVSFGVWPGLRSSPQTLLECLSKQDIAHMGMLQTEEVH